MGMGSFERLTSVVRTRDATNWSVLAVTRFFLAFVVLSVHMPYFYSNGVFETIGLFGGKAAVVGFLVISGFSIASSIDRERRGFLWRRFFRIYPAYVCSLVICLILQTGLGNYEAPGFTFEASDSLTVAGNFLLVQSYLVQRIDYNAVVWSLSLEFSFYVLAILILVRSDAIAVTLMIMSWLFFLVPNDLLIDTSIASLTKANMVRYCWPFIAGYLLYRRGQLSIILFGGLGAVTMLFSPWTPEPLSAFTLLLTTGALLVAGRAKRERPVFNMLGDLSYGLYLFHLPAFIMLHVATSIRSPWAYVAFALMLTLLVERLVERPAQQWGRRWIKARSFSKALQPVQVESARAKG